MFFDQALELCHILRLGHCAKADQRFVQLGVQVIFSVQYIGNTAAHTCGKVLAHFTQDNCAAAGHVFAAVFAHTFYDNRCAGVPDAETLAGYAINKRLAAGCAEQRHVTDDDVFVFLELRSLRREHCQLTAGQALSEIVVAVALQRQGQSLRDKCTKALTACTVTMYHKGIIVQGIVIFPSDLCTKQRTQRTV